jgi:ribosomal protein S12 methylthiotransferase accessory factor
MFSAKMVAESSDPGWAFNELMRMDRLLSDQYFIKFFLGLTSISMNNPLGALTYFEEALKLGPTEEDIPSIYSYMGVCLKDLERYNEALEVLEKGRYHDNERTDIHNLMGFCYFKLKEHQKAIDCFRQVLRLNPASAIDYANIASNYRDMGDIEKAVSYYQLAIELDPTIDFARENLIRLGK